MSNTKKLVLLSFYTAFALALSLIEAQFPLPYGLPGVKLGLANIITIAVIVLLDLKSALLVVTARCILSSVFGGGFVVFIFGITGGLISALVMYILFKRFRNQMSFIGISVAGAVAHNLSQLLVACMIMKQLLILTYLPVLLISAVITGVFVGVCSKYLLKAFEKVGHRFRK